MEKKFKYIMYLILMNTGFIHAQNAYAKITIDSSFDSQSKAYKFVINQMETNTTDKSYTIQLNQFGFDTISYFVNNKLSGTALMKLKSQGEYILKYNPCSFYTFQPIENPIQGMVHFGIEGKDTTRYYVGLDGIPERSISSHDIDEFYYTPPSAMCPFAARTIEIASNYYNTLNQIRYHFLHGELLSIKYNAIENSIEPELFGHVRNKNDYRYYYNKQE